MIPGGKEHSRSRNRCRNGIQGNRGLGNHESSIVGRRKEKGAKARRRKRSSPRDYRGTIFGEPNQREIVLAMLVWDCSGDGGKNEGKWNRQGKAFRGGASLHLEREPTFEIKSGKAHTGGQTKRFGKKRKAGKTV